MVGIDQIAPQRPQPRQRAILVGAGKPAVSDHIRRQNGREFPGLRHGSPFTTRQTSTKTRSELRRLLWPCASLSAMQRYVCTWGNSRSR